MEYDLDELLTNCQNSASNVTHESSTSSSLSSSDNNTILNFFKLPVSPFKSRPHLSATMNNSSLSPQTIVSALSETNRDQTTVPNINSMPNSCSLIFSTAASFNINQNDTVVYARESIRLLAKSLATFSEHQIIRQLYSYAPDNLAWLWAFFDWETPIDLAQVPCQDQYRPFGWCDEDVITASASGLTEDQLNTITRIFAESPLIQYRYRQELMIGDLFKFIEHIQHVSYRPVAVSLFVLYFPRFAPLIDNPLKKFLNPKILSSNIGLIRDLDTMLVKLISTRYNNISEYKQRIFVGPRNLPTYVSHVLKEMNFWYSTTPSNRVLMNMLTSGMNVVNTNNVSPVPSYLNEYSAISQMIQNIDMSGLKSTPKPTSNGNNDVEDILKTLSYLRFLQKSNNINSHLDYEGFEDKIVPNEMINEDEQLGQIDEEPANVFNQMQEQLKLSQTSMTRGDFQHSTAVTSMDVYRSSTRLGCMSPTPTQSMSSAASRLLMNTPQTPTNAFASSYFDFKPSDYWSNGLKQTSSRVNLTPPPSASKTGKETNFYPEPFTSTLTGVDDELKHINKSIYVSSPIPRARYPEFGNYVCNQASGSSNRREVGKNKASPSFGLLNNDDFNTSNGDLALNGHGNLGTLNINTNLSPNINNRSMYSPVIRSPKDQNQFTPTKRGMGVAPPPITMTSPYSGSSSSSMANMKQWSGRLPPKNYPSNAIYSRKVFLGGLPWDLNQNTLVQTLYKYGSVRLEVPGKDSKHPRVSSVARSQLERISPGYVYVIFDHEAAVTRLLADCRKEFRNGSEHYFFNIYIPPLPPNDPRANLNSNGYGSHHTNRRGKLKEVEVIPWNQEDSSYVPPFCNDAPPPKIESSLTVFVGGLHGMCNAQGLATFMAEVFGEVIHAGLDVDKYKYPIGSGRVTFRNRQSYVKAIMAHFVNVRANQDACDPSPKFEKNIQIEPYLEDCKCSKCDLKAQLFCRNEHCLENFCMQCWAYRHDQGLPGEHIALTRQNKHNHGF